MYSVTAKKCRRHDNRHQKVNGTSDHQSWTKGDDCLLSQRGSNAPGYKSGRGTNYSKAYQPRNGDYNGSVSEGQYGWRRTKSVINRHQQGSNCDCG
jgi:hypothetical protein